MVSYSKGKGKRGKDKEKQGDRDSEGRNTKGNSDLGEGVQVLS